MIVFILSYDLDVEKAKDTIKSLDNNIKIVFLTNKHIDSPYFLGYDIYRTPNGVNNMINTGVHYCDSDYYTIVESGCKFGLNWYKRVQENKYEDYLDYFYSHVISNGRSVKLPQRKIKGFIDLVYGDYVIDWKFRFNPNGQWYGEKTMNKMYWIQANLYAIAYKQLYKKDPIIKYIEIKGDDYKIRDMDISRQDEVKDLIKHFYRINFYVNY